MLARALTQTKDSLRARAVRFWGHSQTVSVIVNAEDRERLAAVIGDRNRPLKQILRARIVVLSAERLPVHEIARERAPFRRHRE